MIGYHITNKGIYSSEGSICDKTPFLEFLLNDHPDDQEKVFYDMDANVASLLKLINIDKDQGRRLLEKERLTMYPYRLTLFPRRLFSIDAGSYPGHPFVNFANMGQYTDTHFEPSDSPEDAIAKAKEAARLAREVQDALAYLGLPTDKLTSPVAAFNKQIQTLDLPTIDDMPEEAAKLAYGAVKGNWLEAFTCGYFEANDWDVNACYPFELSKLLDIRRGRWVKRKESIAQAVYGFTEGYITTNARFHPFLYRKEGEMTYTPRGRWHTYLTKQELDFLYDYKLGEFEPLLSWWWIPYGPQYHLYEGVIRWLFQKRQSTKGLAREIIHRIGAGLWGKLTEFRKDQLGPNFNSCYAAIVEANTRIKVTKTCLDCGIVPAHVSVDGIITDQPLPIESSSELGGWRLSHRGRCIIAGAGVVAFEGKGGPEEFSLKFDWLHDEIQRHPRAKSYTMAKYSPVTLALACNGDFRRLGKIVKTTRAVTIGQDSKRLWGDRARNGGDLLKRKFESEPWDYSIVADMESDLGGD